MNSEDYLKWFNISNEAPQFEVPGLSTGGWGIEQEETEDDRRRRRIRNHVPSYKKTENALDYSNYYVEKEQSWYEQASIRRQASLSAGPSGPVRNAPMGASGGRYETVEACTTVADRGREDDLRDVSGIYSRYTFDHTYNERLPIFSKRKEITESVSSYSAVIIDGPTGCGKTTQVPQYILDDCRERNQRCSIVVTQPRRIAARSIAERICMERNWRMGRLVGYQVGLDKEHKSPDTVILYMTTGVLIKRLVTSKKLEPFTHIIIDEVHERDKDTDFLLLIVRKLQRCVSHHVKVVIMSATINPVMFSRYFCTASGSSCPIISIGKQSPYTIKEFYLNDLIDAFTRVKNAREPEATRAKFDYPDPCNPGISADMYELARMLIEKFDDIEGSNNSQSRGSVLVFLPGLEQIGHMRDELEKGKREFNRRWAVTVLHSTVTIDEQKYAFAPASVGYRKILLSTNIAESSITVPDIDYVIDFCLTKNLAWDLETNLEYLRLEWASQVNCRQRRGRVGRVSDGRVYRLVPSQFFDRNVLPVDSSPELQRCPLYRVILNLKKIDLDEPKAMLGLALEPPGDNDIQRTVLLLKEVGGLAHTCEGEVDDFNGDLTFMGVVMEKLPVDIKIARMIVLGHLFGCLEDTIIIAAGLSVRNILSTPLHAELRAFSSKLNWDLGKHSDCLTILNVYKDWKRKEEEQYFKQPGSISEKRWALSAYVQLSALKEMDKLVEEIRKILRDDLNMEVPRPGIRWPTHEDDINNDILLKVVIAGAFYPNYYVKSCSDEKDAIKALSGNDPLNTVMLHGMPDNAFLYEDKIRNIFEVQNLKVEKVTFENTRVYVTFKDDKRQKLSRLNHDMLVALKMRTVRESRRNLTVQLLSPRDAEIKYNMLKQKVEQDFSSMYETDGDAKKIPPPELPEYEDHLTIDIGEIVDAGNFWARRLDNNDKLRDMSRLIDQHYQSMPPVKGCPVIDSIVLAPFTAEGETRPQYYRAKVKEIEGQKGVRPGERGYTTEVLFVDYGGSERLDSKGLRSIDGPLLPLLDERELAFECTLAQIKPNILNSPNGMWRDEATDYAKTLICDPANEQYDILVYSIVNNKVNVELEIRKSSSGFQPATRINLNHTLVSEEYASKAEENYLSKQNRELRELRGDRSERCDASWKGMPHMLLSPASHYATPVSRVNLRGPSNPLEVQFGMLSNYGFSSLTVSVDRDSVNSVLVDEEPQDTHDRILVGAQVSTNMSTSVVNVRHSTLMPNIPGFAALMCLLFCPKAELRHNRDRTFYSGVLCGLGADEESLPYFADNDVEVEFDVVFKEEDIQSINNVRRTMNKPLVEAMLPGEPKFTTNNLRRDQRILKENVLSLLRALRMPIEKVVFPYKREWNRLDERAIFVDPREIPERSVFPPISVIRLNKCLPLKHVIDLYRVAYTKDCGSSGAPRCQLCCYNSADLYDLEKHVKSKDHYYKLRKIFSM